MLLFVAGGRTRPRDDTEPGSGAMELTARLLIEPQQRAKAGHAAATLAIDAANSEAGDELQLGLVTSAAGLAGLEAAWQDLFERAGRPEQVFQTFGFVALFARTHGYFASSTTPDDAGRSRLAIVTAHRHGRLVLIWPMVEQRQFGQRVLSWLGEPIAQYGDVLIDPAEAALPLLQAAYTFVRSALAPDIVRLRKVRADAALAPLLAAIGIAATDVVEAPYVTLAAGGSAFEERQNGKAKKNRRRLMRRLEECGRVAFEEVPATPDVAARVAGGLAGKRGWLTRRGLFSPALADPRLDRFMTAAATDGARATGYAVFTLSLDDRIIAFAHGFRCKRRLMLHLITYAADAEKLGAGVLNLEAILRLAEAEGLEAVDLLPPKAEYKLDWADGAVVVGDYAWGLTARGRLWSGLLDGLVRPRAKQALERLPLSLRQRLSARSLKAVVAPHIKSASAT